MTPTVDWSHDFACTYGKTDALKLKEIANKFTATKTSGATCLWKVLISHVILSVQFKTYEFKLSRVQ